MLGGLWGFPLLEAPPAGARCLGPIRHAYSHFRLELVPAVVPNHRGPPAAGGDAEGDAEGNAEGDRGEPIALERLAALPLSLVDRRVIEALVGHGILPGDGDAPTVPPIAGARR
jgi:hypothetical protein